MTYINLCARVNIRGYAVARRRAVQVAVDAVHAVRRDGSRRERRVLLRLDGLRRGDGHLQHLSGLLAAAHDVRRDAVANLN